MEETPFRRFPTYPRAVPRMATAADALSKRRAVSRLIISMRPKSRFVDGELAN
jgi:hypothetical protein